jgi:hypothetical protein
MVAFGLESGADVNVAAKFALLSVKSDACPLMASVNRLVTAIVVAAFFDGSAILVAVTVTLAGDGRIWGATNTPIGLTVPQAFPEQPGPPSVQVTMPLGLPAEATLACRVCCAPSLTAALDGEVVTLRSLAMVIAAVAVLVGSATLAARTDMVANAGRMGGAVNTPSGEIVPTVALPPAIPATLHVTLVLVAFDTVAAKLVVLPKSTVAVAGVTLSEIAGADGGCGAGDSHSFSWEFPCVPPIR